MAIAKGVKDDVAIIVAAKLHALPSGGMGAITGIPAALGVKMLHQGYISDSGAYPPEAVIDSDRFFDLFSTYCEKTSNNLPLVEIEIQRIADN